MRTPFVKKLSVFAASLFLAAAMLAAVGCSAQSQGGSSASSVSAQTSSGMPTAEDYDKVFEPQSITTAFIGEKLYDQKVTNEDEALAAVKSAYDRIGADDTTDLELTAVRPTETGTTYYIFNQKAGDVLVYSASVKLIVNKDSEAIGLVSAILPKVEMAKAEDWEITAEQAEQIVVKECESNGHAGVTVEAGATEQVLIEVPNTDNKRQYAWVVYTPNYDTDSEMAYLAHYVDGNGTYLYALAIAEPHNVDAEAGDKASFDFGKYEQSTWSDTVTLHDGTTKDIEVPVLLDKSDNSVILADGKRKILCADYAKFAYEGSLSVRFSTENSFDNVELIAYDAFIRVWDFYESIGWTGPDGEGTPTLLLMDYVNKNGEAVDSAFYMGRQHGFQTFTFNRLNPDGENIDVIAHEFTHCVTATTMTTNVYRNETGAINEGMSDVLGNLVEMLIANKPESAWLIGDSSGGGTLRSMKDPHEYSQPEFRWDMYYVPSVITGTETNDRGGVHENSSMLNIVSYKLDQAGMEPADQFYFWMNVALAMTPRTDYTQMAQLLPWCLEQSGYAQYADALKKAIDAAGYPAAQAPSTPPAGTGAISISYPAEEINAQGLVRFTFSSDEGNIETMSWPETDTGKAVCFLPPGNYIALASVGTPDFVDCTMYVYQDGSWVPKTSDDNLGSGVTVEEGKTLELSASGLPEKAEASTAQQ